MGFWSFLFGVKGKKQELFIEEIVDLAMEETLGKKHEHIIENRELKISELNDYYDSIMSRVLDLSKSKDPISFVNKNIIIRCPECGLIYNSEGFEVGYFATLVSDSIPTTFSSGDQGMYGRTSKGLCPNPNCTSMIAVVEWHGGDIGSEPLISSKVAKEDISFFDDPPPSLSTGNASDLVILGKKYLLGQEITQDFQAALKHFSLAAGMGDADAQFFLGNMHDKGDGVPQDYMEALKWYRLAADQGHAIAQFCMGVFYRDGFGVSQDFNEAFIWTRLSAEQGYDEAQFNLGVMFYNGIGVTQNIQEATTWWRKAADQGNVNARHNLNAIE